MPFFREAPPPVIVPQWDDRVPEIRDKMATAAEMADPGLWLTLDALLGHGAVFNVFSGTISPTWSGHYQSTCRVAAKFVHVHQFPSTASGKAWTKLEVRRAIWREMVAYWRMTQLQGVYVPKIKHTWCAAGPSALATDAKAKYDPYEAWLTVLELVSEPIPLTPTTR